MGYRAVPTPLTRSHVRVSPAEPTEGRGRLEGQRHADVRCEFLGPRDCIHPSTLLPGPANPLCASDSFPLECWSFSYSFLEDLGYFRDCAVLSSLQR